MFQRKKRDDKKQTTFHLSNELQLAFHALLVAGTLTAFWLIHHKFGTPDLTTFEGWLIVGRYLAVLVVDWLASITIRKLEANSVRGDQEAWAIASGVSWVIYTVVTFIAAGTVETAAETVATAGTTFSEVWVIYGIGLWPVLMAVFGIAMYLTDPAHQLQDAQLAEADEKSKDSIQQIKDRREVEQKIRQSNEWKTVEERQIWVEHINAFRRTNKYSNSDLAYLFAAMPDLAGFEGFEEETQPDYSDVLKGIVDRLEALDRKIHGSAEPTPTPVEDVPEPNVYTLDELLDHFGQTDRELIANLTTYGIDTAQLAWTTFKAHGEGYGFPLPDDMSFTNFVDCFIELRQRAERFHSSNGAAA